MDRWRKPATPAAVEDDLDDVIDLGDGRVHRNVNATWTKDDIERIKAGYLCMRCWEPLEHPNPAACPLCGYAIRDLQLRDFAREFKGDKHVGPSTSLQAEIDRMHEERERALWTPGLSVRAPRDTTKGGVVLPRGVDAKA